MFIRDWQAGRAEGLARRARRRPAAARLKPRSHLPRLHVLAAIAAVGVTTGVNAAQSPAVKPTGIDPSAPSGQPAEANADAPSSGTSSLSVQLNLDFTNAYFYRGIRQQDRGLLVQPAARLTTRLVDDDDFRLDGFLGTWNSFGPNSGTQTSDFIEDWYESDLYGGFTLTRGNLSLTTSYTFLTSPSDAFQTVQELGFTLALDDSEWLKQWALKPYATLALETGSNGSDSPDLDNGVYLEIGIAPGCSFDIGESQVTLTFPASVGLSLSNYYQDAGGNDDTFGFAQVGAKASLPLGEPGRFGAWTLNAGVSALFLGDHTKAFNKGEDTEVIGTLGLQCSF
ncbi:MAG: hypothetical protein WC718_08015 [Phycisphaerales bacterium]|jgi:hypothetical protein